VYVYSGSTTTGTLARDRKLFGSDFGGFSFATVGQFGSALAVGDFDGDGNQDLAVGAPRTTVNGAERAGAVFLYRGTDYSTVPPSEVQGAGAVSWGRVASGSIEDAFLIHQETEGVF
jgi:hypothetical protein